MSLTEHEIGIIKKLSRVDDILPKIETMRDETKRGLRDASEIYNKIDKIYRDNTELEALIIKITEEQNIGCPWASDLIAKYHEARGLRLAAFLNSKSHPAYKTSELVKEFAKENRILRRQLLVAQNYVEYLKQSIPGLEDVTEDELNLLLKEINDEGRDDEIDPVSTYIPKEEYDKLDENVRNQLALDRYWHREMSHYQIGKAYERYIGYFFEELGYKVNFHGIKKGFSDWGRDLLCKKDNQTVIVQCKCWSRKKEKEVRENAVNQLFGTTVEYIVDNFRDSKEWDKISFTDLLKHYSVVPMIVTTTKLSDTAKLFAKSLGVEIREFEPLNKKYPFIKCHINKHTGEKIYHLPFDQQYDNIVIEKQLGECYVHTVQEAISCGFLRRAWRWHGNDEDGAK